MLPLLRSASLRARYAGTSPATRTGAGRRTCETLVKPTSRFGTAARISAAVERKREVRALSPFCSRSRADARCCMRTGASATRFALKCPPIACFTFTPSRMAESSHPCASCSSAAVWSILSGGGSVLSENHPAIASATLSPSPTLKSVTWSSVRSGTGAYTSSSDSLRAGPTAGAQNASRCPPLLNRRSGESNTVAHFEGPAHPLCIFCISNHNAATQLPSFVNTAIGALRRYSAGIRRLCSCVRISFVLDDGSSSRYSTPASIAWCLCPFEARSTKSVSAGMCKTFAGSSPLVGTEASMCVNTVKSPLGFSEMKLRMIRHARPSASVVVASVVIPPSEFTRPLIFACDQSSVRTLPDLST